MKKDNQHTALKKYIKSFNCFIILLFLFVLTYSFSGCRHKENKPDPNGLNETIIVYFSPDDSIKNIAEHISEKLQCGIYEIVPDEEYTREDMNFADTESRCFKEHKNQNLRPGFGNMMPALSIYNRLIIIYPLWYNEAPNILYTYIESNKDIPKNMTVVPIVISDNNKNSDSSAKLLKKVKAKKEKEKNLKSDISDKELDSFISMLK